MKLKTRFMHTGYACRTGYSAALLLISLCFVATTLSASSLPYISGHGINFAVGNKYLAENDLSLTSPAGLSLTFNRSYNSQSFETGPLGFGWSSSYGTKLKIKADRIILLSATGKYFHYINNGAGAWINETGKINTITPIATGYQLTLSNGNIILFASDGRITEKQELNGRKLTYIYTGENLTSVADSFGRTLSFTYNDDGFLNTLTTPVGLFSYTYDVNKNLVSILKPDGTTREYIYDDPNDIHNLTGITDEAGERILTAAYDIQDRVVNSSMAEGSEQLTVEYLPNLQRKITNSKGVVSTYQLEQQYGIYRVTSFTGPGCSACGSDTGSEYIYDSRQLITQVTDAKGTITSYTYDALGNRSSKTEAVNTGEERTTNWTYVPGSSRVATTSKNSASNTGQQSVTTMSYDPTGNLTSRTASGFTGTTAITRTTRYTYDSLGRITAIDGSLPGASDSTSFVYYPNDPAEGANRANLHTVTNALGHVTTYADYNAYGKAELITPPYGSPITMTFDAMGRLLTRTRGNSSTTYQYYADGKIHIIQLSDARTVTYTYTLSGKPETITDSLNNKITYTYDSTDKQIRQEIHDPQNLLQHFVEYSYEDTGDLDKIIQADGSFEDMNYDSVGNLVTRINALNKTTAYSYDTLNRLTALAAPGTVTTGYSYDSNDNLTSVTDAENKQTVFAYDDFGRKISRQSPDTGPVTYIYDPADNLLKATDSNNITTTYEYDILNRLTAIHYPDSTQDILYTFDENGYTGLLTTMQDSTGTTSYQYNLLAQLTGEARTQDGKTFTLGYTYSDNGEPASITYPGSRVVAYNRNAAGQITSITSTHNGTTSTVADNITYKPFGPREDMVLGNGVTVDNTYNQLYRLTNTTAGSIYDRGYQYFATGHVQAITDTIDPTASQNFTYDDLGRLTGSQGKYGTYNWTYDNVGNRLTQTLGTDTTTYTYETGTGKLIQASSTTNIDYAYDAAGNMTNRGTTEFVWNQNNRLINALENASPVGAYSYDGRGLRTSTTVNGTTTYFIYDNAGNLVAETDAQGNTLREFAYIDGTRLALFEYSQSPDLTVSVVTSDGRNLENVNTYAFTEAGAYAGITSKTDTSGVAVYDRADFLSGNYKFRIDYLGSQFWSSLINAQQASSVQVVIDEAPVQLTITLDGAVQPGVKVYLFSESGAYLGLYAVTDSNGQVSFTLPAGENYKFRADLLGNQYWSDVVTVQSGGSSVAINTGGGVISITLAEAANMPLAGIKTYLFSPSGSYLGVSATSDSGGQVAFSVPSGAYTFRADYLGYQFWTPEYVVTTPMQTEFLIPHQDVDITVFGDMGGDVLPFEGVSVYLFSPAGSYLSVSQATDATGKVTFHLPTRDYKVRADYLNRKFWSSVFNAQNTPVTIEEGIADITVTNMGVGVAGITLYVFSDTGSYLGINGVTDAQGRVSFRLPAGSFTFRADYQGNQYWSGNTTLFAHMNNDIPVSTGGGSFVMTVLAGENQPLVGVKTYLFSANGSYLGITKTTDNQGQAAYNLADGSYKIRVDYLGYQYWAQPVTIPGSETMEYLIQHQDVVITAASTHVSDSVALDNVSVYLFTPAGSYLGITAKTDAAGQAIFSLPPQDYKVRVDYLGNQYWSTVFNQADTDVTVNNGIAEISLVSGGSPATGVPVYVFSAAGNYLGLTETTDASGQVQFRLPEGSYKFRADYQGNQYWAMADILAHQRNPVDLNAGGGTLSITVKSGESTILADVACYLFSASGGYLGQTARTDANGIVTFDVADGNYKIRVDFFNNQFWSSVLSVPTTLSDTIMIEHQAVTVSVNMDDGSLISPLADTLCYLFTDAGTYTGHFAVADQNGAVTFNVPLNTYKVRADYLGSQYWSATFDWFDTDITIAHGAISMHVTDLGADVVGAKVYLFSETGVYLGVNTTTDGLGMAGFTVPARAYKLRVDHGGNQYWTDVVNVLAYQDNPVNLALDLLALNLTNNPSPQRMDGKPPVYMPQVATLGSLTGLLAQVVTQAVPTSEARTFYYVSDHLSTAQLLLDDQGAVVWQGNFTPFGEVDIVVNTLENNFRFPGQYFDAETGLHYNWNRYYDPATGRYITADPIGLEGGMNLYAYVGGNPVNWVDFMGLMEFDGIEPFGEPVPHREPIIGPFGTTCGAEGSDASRWIPDVTPRACQRHDDCYENCARNCYGMWCKTLCDAQLGGSNPPYGGATLYFGKDAYDAAKERYGCEGCNE